MMGQTIYYYVVSVVYQKKGRYKKPLTFRTSGLEAISRAKTIGHLNRDRKAMDFLQSQVRGTGTILNFRVYKIESQKEIGTSAVHLEKEYDNEWN